MPQRVGPSHGIGFRVHAWQPTTFTFVTDQGPDTNPSAPFDEAADDVVAGTQTLLANPWLHWRFTLRLTNPQSSRSLVVPGYFAGDGLGHGVGRAWQVRLNVPNLPGIWDYEALLERGPQLNVALPSSRGQIAWRQTGFVSVQAARQDAEGFLARGRLRRSAGYHYLRFDDRSFFIEGGVNSPENFLGYAGFTGFENDATDGTGGSPGALGFRHRYAPHVQDWRLGDPDWSANGAAQQGRGIIGALNALAEMGANSIYCLPMNLGGDGRETHPFLDNSDDGVTGEAPVDPGHVLHWSVRRMHEWNIVLEHAQRKGILVQFVLAEREPGNIAWLGSASSVARRLYLKNLVTMFGHLNALRWNLCEENGPEHAPGLSHQFTIDELTAMATWIGLWDVHDHPLTVHTEANTQALYDQIRARVPASQWWLDATSLQLHGGECTALDWNHDCIAWAAGSAATYGAAVETARQSFLSGGLGQALVVCVDEQGAGGSGAADDSPGHGPLHSDWTSVDRRRRILYDTYFSGGNLEWYFGYHDLAGAAGENGGGDIRTENFRTRAAILEVTTRVRALLETVPFWEMQPADGLLQPWQGPLAVHPLYGRPEVFALNGEVALVYYPSLRNNAGALDAGSLDLAPAPPGARFRVRWRDATTLDEVGSPYEFLLAGSRRWAVTTPGFSPGIDQDLVLSVERVH